MNVLFILPQQAGRFQTLRVHQGIQSLSGFIKSRDRAINTRLLRLESLDTKKITDFIKNFKPHLICITYTSLEIKLARAISGYIRKEYQLPVILEGIHPTIAPEDALNNGDKTRSAWERGRTPCLSISRA